MKDIIKYCVDNPDESVENIAKKFKIPDNSAFHCVKEASKVLNDNKLLEAKKEGIQSVFNMLEGDTDRKKIANYIKEYLKK